MVRWLARVVLLIGLTLPRAGAAQKVTLNPYAAPFTVDDGLALSRPEVLRHRESSGLVVLDYANDPLVVEVRRGDADSERARLVQHQATAQLRFAFGLYNRLAVMAGLDAVLAMSGQRYALPGSQIDLRPADGGGLGDGRLGLRYLPIGGAKSLWSLAVQAQLTLPLAELVSSGQHLRGEKMVSFRPQLLAQAHPRLVRVTINVGAVVRKDGRLIDSTMGDQLTFGIGLAGDLPGKLSFVSPLAEVHGATTFSRFFGRPTTPVELLLGVRAKLAGHWHVAVAAGPGLSRGVGTPDYRLLATLGFATARLLDSDGDGINDRRDACRRAPEDVDGFRDEDGCPDPDNDADGVDDLHDHCPAEPEDADYFEDWDGCAEPDNDRDGILDSVDACPREPEDHDGFEDENGCPDL